MNAYLTEWNSINGRGCCIPPSLPPCSVHPPECSRGRHFQKCWFRCHQPEKATDPTQPESVRWQPVFGNRGLTLPLPQAVLWICSPYAPDNSLRMKPVHHLTVSGWLKQHFPVTLLHSSTELTAVCILFLYHVSPFFLPPLYILFSWLHSSTFMCSFELPVHPSFQCDSTLFFEVPFPWSESLGHTALSGCVIIPERSPNEWL